MGITATEADLNENLWQKVYDNISSRKDTVSKHVAASIQDRVNVFGLLPTHIPSTSFSPNGTQLHVLESDLQCESSAEDTQEALTGASAEKTNIPTEAANGPFDEISKRAATEVSGEEEAEAEAETDATEAAYTSTPKFAISDTATTPDEAAASTLTYSTPSQLLSIREQRKPNSASPNPPPAPQVPTTWSMPAELQIPNTLGAAENPNSRTIRNLNALEFIKNLPQPPAAGILLTLPLPFLFLSYLISRHSS